MKKAAIIVMTVLLAAFLASCAGEKGIKAGSASAEALMKLLPENTQAVLAIDVGRAMGTTVASKSLENEQAKKGYEEMVQSLGMDPKKDVFHVVMGVTGRLDAKQADAAVLVNLRYEKDRLLEMVRSKAPELIEESYSGLTLYKARTSGPSGPMGCGAFLDDSNILVGTEAAVKAVVDVYQNKAASIAKNEEMARALKPVNMSAIAWGAVNIPQDMLSAAIAANPMLKAMEGITAVNMSFDYRNRALLIDIRTIGGTEEQNENLAATLNGLKGMGAMMAGQEPDIGEAVGGIEVTSGKDYVRLYATLSEELLQKLQETAQTKIGDIVQPGKEPVEEVKK